MNFLSKKIPFVNTSWVIAHNSFANKEDGWFYAQQQYNLTNLFEKGIRGFMIDIHYHNNEISLCHELSPKRNPADECLITKMSLGFLSSVVKLESFLTALYNLIVHNPSEIIILFLECYVPMQEVVTLFDKANLSKFLLTTNPNKSDLTIGDIIDKKTPLIVFSDYANPKNEHLIDGFFHTKNYKESKYNLAEYRGCEDRNENSRTKYDQKVFYGQEINLFLLNHFYQTSIKVPGLKNYQEINDYHSIQERGIKCKKESSLFPNFIAVDYIEEGNCGGVFRYVDEQNYKTLALTTNDCAPTGKIEFCGNNLDRNNHAEL